MVEDHPPLLTQVEQLLAAGFTVVQGLPGGAGLAKAVKTFKPDLLVMDITLPGVNGLELTRQIRATSNGPRVVMLTVHADPDYVQAALRAGASGYVLKSRLASDLVPALHSALADKLFVSDGIDQPSVHRGKTPGTPALP